MTTIQGQHGKDCCFLCEMTLSLETHHVDWHHSNNDPDNRIRLCKSCHAAAHKAGYCSVDELIEVKKKAKERDPTGELRQKAADERNKEQNTNRIQLDLFGN